MIKLGNETVNWNIGDTSFRRKHMIEEYAFLLNNLFILNEKYSNWNNESQVIYYEMIASKLSAKSENIPSDTKSKRARTFTNALQKLGFCDKNRVVTAVGKNYIDLFYNNGELEKDDFEKILNINDINLLYLRQLLKLEINSDMGYFYPIIGLMHLIKDFGYISKIELQIYTFVKNIEDYNKFVINLESYRAKNIDEYKFIYDFCGFSIDQDLYNRFLSELNVSNIVVNEVFKNRKSQGQHTKKIIELIEEIEKCVIAQTEKNFNNLKQLICSSSYDTLNLRKEFSININTKYSTDLWEHAFFNNDIQIRRSKLFEYINMKKHYNNSKDYSDILVRVLSRTGIFDCRSGISFKGNVINLLLFHNELPILRLVQNDIFTKNVSCVNIFGINPMDTFNREYGWTHDDLVLNELEFQEMKFVEFVKEKFSRNKIIGLLRLFENDLQSNRGEINKQVTENASISTIYEYIMGIAWYYISEEKYNLLDSFNLILDGDYLPETHAPGLRGDIEIIYNKNEYYDKHGLLLELTLMEKHNQRRNELEPVIRHSYNFKFDTKNSYSMFISNKIDENVQRIFSVCDGVPFKTNGGEVENIDIFALSTIEIINILEANITYKDIYLRMKSSSHVNGDPYKIENFRLKYRV